MRRGEKEQALPTASSATSSLASQAGVHYMLIWLCYDIRDHFVAFICFTALVLEHLFFPTTVRTKFSMLTYFHKAGSRPGNLAMNVEANIVGHKNSCRQTSIGTGELLRTTLGTHESAIVIT